MDDSVVHRGIAITDTLAKKGAADMKAPKEASSPLCKECLRTIGQLQANVEQESCCND